MKHIMETEVFDDKEVILHDIIDYDNNIVNNNMSEEKQREIEKLNEEFRIQIFKEFAKKFPAPKGAGIDGTGFGYSVLENSCSSGRFGTINFLFVTAMASRVLLAYPVFDKMLETWYLTVLSATSSLPAISSYSNPSQISRSTSISFAVSSVLSTSPN